MGAALAILLLVASGQAGDWTLKSELSGDDDTIWAFSSAMQVEKVGKDRRTLTSTVTSYVTISRTLFTLPSGESGSIPAASAEGAKVVPCSLTMERSTYRPVRTATDSIHGSNVGGRHEFKFTASFWSEGETTVPAFPGAKLVARLLDGGANGKGLLLVTSEVTGDKAKGYVYSYSVENLSDKSLGFRFGGMQQKLQPKKSFSKKEVSDKLMEEKSELLTIDFDDGQATIVMKANLWAPPK